MNKFFVNATQVKDEIIEIQGSDVNHIKNVLRLKIGEKIEVGNLQTVESYICKIQEINDIIICHILETRNLAKELPVRITIFQGLPKFDKMEWIIQKCTELGAFAFVPVKFERCVVKLNETDELKKRKRWQTIAEVASKQSKRDIVPKIKPAIKINQLETVMQEYDEIFVAYENEKENTLKNYISQIKQKNSKDIAIIIGPEGGISEKEIESLRLLNIKSVRLGNRILRTETAPIAFCSMMMYEFEDEIK